MDRVGLAKMLRQVCHKKGAGGKHQMLNLVQATKYAFICWQQRDSVGTYHERFLATLKVVEAVDCTIRWDVATAKIVIEEWVHDTSNPGSIPEDKRHAAMSEG